MLPLFPFDKIAKNAGINRISKNALEEYRDIREELALETAEKAVKVSFHANRRTVMASDVQFVTNGK